MPPPYRRVAVIGAGPAGYAVIHALSAEKIFDSIRLFERKDQVGGVWIYDQIPDVFPISTSEERRTDDQPSTLPTFTAPALEDTTSRSGVYESLDSNVGAKVMAFSHTPFPEVNSAVSTEKYGRNNPSRPYTAVAGYLEDLFKKYLHLVSLETTVERVEKVDDEWVLTLRRSNQLYHGKRQDYWWEERFDAVVVASGHYSLPAVPSIPGLDETYKVFPDKFEHSKSFRKLDNYVDKKVVLVGASISAADFVSDAHSIVRGPLFVSQRTPNPFLQDVWDLPNVQLKPIIKRISPQNGGTIEFVDGSLVTAFDKIFFATGYQLSYPFLRPNPVTTSNRLSGFYQHLFKIGDPSLVVVGQIKAAVSFLALEYQAVAAARVLAGRGTLPDAENQKQWEIARLKEKGPTLNFHQIKPEFAEYYSALIEIAGAPAADSEGYQLPPWDDKWEEEAFGVLELKKRYWRSQISASENTTIKAKL